MRVLLAAALALLVSAAALPASRGAQPADPRAPRIDAMLERFGGGTPGCALGVMRAGDLVYVRGHGLASLDFEAGFAALPLLVMARDELRCAQTLRFTRDAAGRIDGFRASGPLLKLRFERVDG